jgi:arylsulfatase A-like enzyme
MLRWPGHTQAARHEDLVSTIDLVPTMLSAAGLKAPPQMPGLSLLDVACGRGKLQRDAVFGEIFVHTAVDINQPALNLTHRWVRAGDWKLISFEEAPAHVELYNVTKDPFENRDLSADNPNKVGELQKRIQAWWKARDELRSPK